jgi:hypothetical protein
MTMGKRKRERQPSMWVAPANVPTAASHPFYTRLNQLPREHGFDDFAEGRPPRRLIQWMPNLRSEASVSGCFLTEDFLDD